MDEELIGLKAKDIGTKFKTEQKAGKNGPVVDAIDAIANSQTGCLFGMLLRFSGETDWKMLLYCSKDFQPFILWLVVCPLSLIKVMVKSRCF